MPTAEIEPETLVQIERKEQVARKSFEAHPTGRVMWNILRSRYDLLVHRRAKQSRHPVSPVPREKPSGNLFQRQSVEAWGKSRGLLIKRPSPESVQRAKSLWMEELKRYGIARLAKARNRPGQQEYLQMGRAAAYAGDEGIIVLVKSASSAPSAEARAKILDIVESIRNLGSKIQAFATFEHLWPDGTAAVSVHHDRLGWLEFDVLGKVLPEGVQPRDQFEVRLHLDRAGNVVHHRVPPGAKIIRSKEPSIGDMLESRLPRPPKNWDDEVDMDRYQRELNAWEKKTGMGQREPQAG